MTAALCLLALPVVAGPSLPHLGEHPQGQTGRVEPTPWTLPWSRQEDTSETDDANPETGESAALGADSAAPAGSAPLCPASARHYRKSLLITAFPRRTPASSNAGRLHGAEQHLPRMLGEQLAGSGQLAGLQKIGQALPRAADNPTRRAQQVRQLAHRSNAQLVLTGELVELALAQDRAALAPGLLNRGRNALVGGLRLNPDWDTRQRDFVLELSLLDGLTGEPVYTQQFHRRGIWNPKRAERTAFGTPGFWETDYGEKIQALMEEVGAELNEAIRCVPLAARLEAARPGQPLILHAGVEQGLHPGDRLPLYRVAKRAVQGEYRQYSAHLIQSDARVTVREAYPDYSLVELEGDGPLRGTHVALSPGAQPLAAGR
ncbi:flagella assembly protein FlgT middle domain-containing protein [Marinimicrobium sp. C2-29]|uniref:flagella assembly protein FlgT middle domain-containing protein n=1 Tax=Marinimicrobium sp. C2-29 TaxID=3139825 RepID=UPI00313975C3